MKLAELKAPEKFSKYIDRLVNELGIERIGQGVLGHVFKHPTHPEIAVKVYMKDAAFDYYEADMHKGNIMTSAKHLVFIDPLA